MGPAAANRYPNPWVIDESGAVSSADRARSVIMTNAVGNDDCPTPINRTQSNGAAVGTVLIPKNPARLTAAVTNTIRR